MLALTHIPSPALECGQRTYAERQPLDYAQALRQHADYCAMLRRCGVQVQVLEINRDLADSTFIEDTAIVLDEVAVLASMGTEARRAELAGVEPELWRYREVRRVELPALLEGGDVLRVGRNLLVGISARTNFAAMRELETIVRRHGYRVLPVPVHGCLHLKTACTALPDGGLLINPDWIDVTPLRDFETVPVPSNEPWAANVLQIQQSVCLPTAHVETAERMRALGFEVHPVDLSEFAKAEGGATCLSLLF